MAQLEKLFLCSHIFKYIFGAPLGHASKSLTIFNQNVPKNWAFGLLNIYRFLFVKSGNNFCLR